MPGGAVWVEQRRVSAPAGQEEGVGLGNRGQIGHAVEAQVAQLQAARRDQCARQGQAAVAGAPTDQFQAQPTAHEIETDPDLECGLALAGLPATAGELRGQRRRQAERGRIEYLDGAEVRQQRHGGRRGRTHDAREHAAEQVRQEREQRRGEALIERLGAAGDPAAGGQARQATQAGVGIGAPAAD